MAACATLAGDMAWPYGVFWLVHVAFSVLSKWPSLDGPHGAFLLVYMLDFNWSTCHVLISRRVSFVGPRGAHFISPRVRF
jgi:hypothetical protein